SGCDRAGPCDSLFLSPDVPVTREAFTGRRVPGRWGGGGLARSRSHRILSPMTRRCFWLAALAGAVALALSACGGGGETKTTSRTVQSTGVPNRVTTNVPEINQV